MRYCYFTGVVLAYFCLHIIIVYMTFQMLMSVTWVLTTVTAMLTAKIQMEGLIAHVVRDSLATGSSVKVSTVVAMIVLLNSFKLCQYRLLVA